LNGFVVDLPPTLDQPSSEVDHAAVWLQQQSLDTVEVRTIEDASDAPPAHARDHHGGDLSPVDDVETIPLA